MLKVLLVDDAPEIRDFVAAFLTDEGVVVELCERAEEALERLVAAQPDLLILDGRLPGMSGWECLDLLRADDRTARLPVLLMTAAVDDLQRVARPLDECTRHLAKPFDLDELLAAIQDVIDTCTQDVVAV